VYDIGSNVCCLSGGQYKGKTYVITILIPQSQGWERIWQLPLPPEAVPGNLLGDAAIS